MKTIVVALSLLASVPALAQSPALDLTPTPDRVFVPTPAFDLRPDIDDAKRLRNVGIGTLAAGAALGIASAVIGSVYVLEGIGTLDCAFTTRTCAQPTHALYGASIGLAVPAVAMIVTGAVMTSAGARRMKQLRPPTVQLLGSAGHTEGATVSMGLAF